LRPPPTLRNSELPPPISIKPHDVQTDLSPATQKNRPCDKVTRFLRSFVVAFWVLLAVSQEVGWLVVVGWMALWAIRRIAFAL
jgi:hypothetical protein